jgi:hypothetical protein
MTIVNSFTNGTVADADEVNGNFTPLDKISGTVHTAEAGAYTHTGDTTMTTLRTYTVGGISGLGYKLAFVTCEVTASDAGGESSFRIYRAGSAVNLNEGPDHNSLCIISNAGTNIMTAIIPVDHGDTIIIKGANFNGSYTVGVQNIKIFCGEPDITFTGS